MMSSSRLSVVVGHANIFGPGAATVGVTSVA
jgi:hypothetical protein